MPKPASELNLTEALNIPKLPTYVGAVQAQMQTLVRQNSPNLKLATQRILGYGGKRLRPSLVIAAAAVEGQKTTKEVIRAAAAIELAHLASIVHDDIIDNSATRRGKATIHQKEGIDMAILVGDNLLALASNQASSVSKELGQIVSGSIATMCDGQTLEVLSRYDPKRTASNYLEVTAKKTGALISAACRLGGLCGGLSPGKVEALANFGQAFGMSFQILDDLLDFMSTTALMAKPVGNDMKEGVYTLPLLIALQGPSGAEVRKWLTKKPSSELSRFKIAQKLIAIGAVEETLKEVNKFNHQAAQQLQNFKDTSVIEGLSELPDKYTKWALQKKVDPSKLL